MRAARFMLADVSNPPDTSQLAPCSESETAACIEDVRRRLLRRRKALLARRGTSRALDAVIASLRRLQNPQLCAYRTSRGGVVSEPFNGIPSATAPAPRETAIRELAEIVGTQPPHELINALAPFGSCALNAARRAGVKITLVPDGRMFRDISSSVARCAPGIDDWPAPPSGLFVVADRHVLLRKSAMRMTAAHEFAHALDSVIARRPKSYFSFESEELRYYFATATGYVNEYAASGLDEYFAESVRAYVEVNDERCSWLPLTRQDLYLRDPRMFALVDRLFRSNFEATERRTRPVSAQ
jgi:hypothetical protein